MVFKERFLPFAAKAHQINIFRFTETRHTLEMSHTDRAHSRLPRRYQLVPTERHH